MNLFIDTNVFLSFFHFSSDDLEELRKLAVLVRKGTITLIVPAQVRSEFRRNRDGTVAEALKRLREQKVTVQFPQLCKDYAEYDSCRAALRTAEDTRVALISALEADVNANGLKADKVIAELFANARSIDETGALLERVKDRVLRGNPPGKKGSHGDSLNWEALLESVANGQDLFFVSGDGDWVSPLDNEQFNSFLRDEWERTKGSSLSFYRRLSVFFREYFPDINLATEEEKERLIRALASSGTFARSRSTLQQLAAHGEFTIVQLNEIARAATTNNQVYWIITDADISRYVRGMLAPHKSEIEPDLVTELERLLERALTDDAVRPE